MICQGDRFIAFSINYWISIRLQSIGCRLRGGFIGALLKTLQLQARRFYDVHIYTKDSVVFRCFETANLLTPLKWSRFKLWSNTNHPSLNNLELLKPCLTFIGIRYSETSKHLPAFDISNAKVRLHFPHSVNINAPDVQHKDTTDTVHFFNTVKSTLSFLHLTNCYICLTALILISQLI